MKRIVLFIAAIFFLIGMVSARQNNNLVKNLMDEDPPKPVTDLAIERTGTFTATISWTNPTETEGEVALDDNFVVKILKDDVWENEKSHPSQMAKELFRQFCVSRELDLNILEKGGKRE